MDDAEYDAYVLARWPALVRAAVGLGCDAEEARDLAQTTLLRCYVAWRKVRKARDRDAYVYRILLNCHRDSQRRQWWGEVPTAEMPDRGTAETRQSMPIWPTLYDARWRTSTTTAGGRRAPLLRPPE